MGADPTNETEKRLRYSGVDQRKEKYSGLGYRLGNVYG